MRSRDREIAEVETELHRLHQWKAGIESGAFRLETLDNIMSVSDVESRIVEVEKRLQGLRAALLT